MSTRSSVEVVVRFLAGIVWSASLLFASWKFFQVSVHHRDHLERNAYVEESWTGKFYRDRGDLDWTFWISELCWVIPCLILRSFFFRFLPQKLRIVLLPFDLFCIYLRLGILALSFQLVLASLFFVVILSESRLLLWSLIGLVFWLRYITRIEEFASDIQIDQHYRVECTTSFIIARAVIFGAYYQRSAKESSVPTLSKLFRNFVEYQFFSPLFWNGPIVSYDQFRAKQSNGKKRTLKSAVKIAVFAVLYEILIHFVHPFSTRIDPALLRRIDLWSLAGNGYLLGQLFHLKYCFLYGLFSCFAQLSDVEAFQQPICVAWVHRYSLMWKHFDRGLYRFLVENVYKPLVEYVKWNHVASLGCYVFVLCWHGFAWHILVWISMNWISLVFEYFLYKRIRNWVLRAVLNSLVLIVSMVSNMFFLGESFDFGYQILKRILLENSIVNLLGVYLIFFCCSLAGDGLEWRFLPRKP